MNETIPMGKPIIKVRAVGVIVKEEEPPVEGTEGEDIAMGMLS